jgi:hypothetical protein
MSAALTHRCPVRGCEVQVVNSKLMCSRHWGRVSAATGREVYAAYKEAKLSRRHADAMAQAIREANGEAAS